MALVNTSAISGTSREAFGARYEAFKPSGSRATQLPGGFPSFLPTDLAWKGSDLCDESVFIYRLTESDISELDAALDLFNACELDGDLVNSETFPLPNLSKALQALRDELYNGKGFFLIRGLDLQKYSVADSTTIFLGIQSYIAEQKARQDNKGNMIVHINSDSPPFSSPTRSFHFRHSTSSISFHNEEATDIVTWQTRSTAARGGSCILSSAYTIYNTLAATRPDIICTLSKSDWPFALPHFHSRPILFYHASHLIINYSRAALLGSQVHPRPGSLPSLTSTQREALDVLEALAVAYQVEFTTQPGDMHFVNNLALLHRRAEFVDDDDNHDTTNLGSRAKDFETTVGNKSDRRGARKRHLVRMKVRNREMGWDIPGPLQEEWDGAFGEEGERVWHIEPMPERFFPLRKYGF